MLAPMLLLGCAETVLPPVPEDLEVSLELPYDDLANFDQPVAMTYDTTGRDGPRWYVAERSGRVQVFDDVENVTDSLEILDISDEVASTPSEAGLLGIALHPDFATEKQIFLSFTRLIGRDLFSQVVRSLADTNGEFPVPELDSPLLSIRQDEDNNNGGHLAFDADGLLYAGFGDGGGDPDPEAGAQDRTNLLGSIIRIDVRDGVPYRIPDDNPFASDQLCDDPNTSRSIPCPEIFAWGLRNPWRFSFETGGQRLWVGDVGEDSVEEINLVENGDNLGWPIREGDNCKPPATRCRSDGLVAPVFEYGRALGQSVTGGFQYRGSDIPELNGAYLFADFASGRLWALFQDTDGDFTPLVLIENTGLSIVDFAEGAGNEVYLLDYTGGRIYRLRES
jgi:glucose/arabinose dehydrogenase